MTFKDTNIANIDLKTNNENLRHSRPPWLKVRAPGGENFSKIKNMMRAKSLHTVCEEAHCPNISECWNCGTATFIILGDVCSRACRFCNVANGIPKQLDSDEPKNVAESIKQMNLAHAVITSVTRDDLEDGGAVHWALTIEEIKKLNPNTTIEALIPDFKGIYKNLLLVLDAKPDILNHNVETVPRLYSKVRPQANYTRSLDILNISKEKGFLTKSGLMAGFGETSEEIIRVMNDLRSVNVDFLTIGQYLQPSKKHLPVDKFIHPNEFEEFKRIGLELGFNRVESAPLVRSSYHAKLS